MSSRNFFASNQQAFPTLFNLTREKPETRTFPATLFAETATETIDFGISPSEFTMNR